MGNVIPPRRHLYSGGMDIGILGRALNTVTTLAIFFERSSHVSGRLSDVGMNAVLLPIDALLVFLIWITFVFGAFLAEKLLDRIGFTHSLLLIDVGVSF
jgi:hypothetical protein